MGRKFYVVNINEDISCVNYKEAYVQAFEWATFKERIHLILLTPIALFIPWHLKKTKAILMVIEE